MAQEKFAQDASLKHKSEGSLASVVLTPGQILEGVRGNVKGKYIIEKYLGEGWTAVVYLGADVENPELKVALKILRPGSSEITVSSFRNEMQIISSIRNQGITCVPEIYGLFKGDSYEFIAMELVSDQEYPRLDHILDLKGPLSEDDALLVARQTLILLDRLHNQVGRTYTDMQLKNFCWNAVEKRLLVIDWNHVSYERKTIEDGVKNNVPSVIDQLRNRGNAKDFSDLTWLDILRFSTFFYTFLTGKRAKETGETVWSLKNRAGKQWESLSESIRSIVLKSLIEYPGGERYKTASEMLKAVETAWALGQNTDLDGLRSQLGELLDRVDDGDEALSKDTNPIAWIGERQTLVSDAISLLSRIEKLSDSNETDPNLSKWTTRQSDRIQSLVNGVSPTWGTGERYFELGQYLTAMSYWKPEVERQGFPRLWRLILLAQAATEVDGFSSIQDYFYTTSRERSIQNVGALNLLDKDDIDSALARFNSGTAGLKELKGSLAVLKTELTCLQLIKQANVDLSLSVENLGAVARLLNESPFPYQNIVLRDPLWYALVADWLSQQQKETFTTTGELNLDELIAAHLRWLEEQAHRSSVNDSAMLETEVFVKDVLFSRKTMESLQKRLWANPADDTLSITLLAILEKQLPSLPRTIDAILERISKNPVVTPRDHAFIQMLDDLDATRFFTPVSQEFKNSGDAQQLETTLRSNHETLRGPRLMPVLQQMLGMSLQWGANSEDMEKRLRSQYFSLTASMYIDHLNKAIKDKNWELGEQSARNLVWLKGRQSAEMDFTSQLADDFAAEYKQAQNALEKKQFVLALQSEERLKKLGHILDIVDAQTPNKRQEQIQEISDGVGGINNKRKELREITRRLEGLSILSDLMTDFIDESREAVGVDGEPAIIDYQLIGEKADQHLQLMEDKHKDWVEYPGSRFKEWTESVKRYKGLSEAFMQEKTQFAEFERFYKECVEAISKRDINLAHQKLGAANATYNLLGQKTRDDLTTPLNALRAGVQTIDTFIKQFNDAQVSFGEFTKAFIENYKTNGILDRSGLEEAKSICSELLQLQGKCAEEFKKFAPSFKYEGLDKLDDRIQRWEQLFPFAEILEKQQKPVVFVGSEPNTTIVVPIDSKPEHHLRPWWENRRFVILSGVLAFCVVAVAAFIWVPKLIASFNQPSPTETVAVISTQPPANIPTETSTVAPTEEPTAAPTEEPTAVPTEEPTAAPTEEPTQAPSLPFTDLKVERWDALCPHPITSDTAQMDFDLPPLRLPQPPAGWTYEVRNRNAQLFIKDSAQEFEVKVSMDGQPAFGWFAPGDMVSSQVAQPCYTTDPSIAWVPPQYSYDRYAECPEGCKAIPPGVHAISIRIGDTKFREDLPVTISSVAAEKIALETTDNYRIAPILMSNYKCGAKQTDGKVSNACDDEKKYWMFSSIQDELHPLFICDQFTAVRYGDIRLWQWLRKNYAAVPAGYCPSYAVDPLRVIPAFLTPVP